MKWGAEKWICNTTCGDGLRAGLEECDDGNLADLDGCSANCSVEPRFNCTPMELPKIVATLPYPKMVAGAPSICLRDNCFQVQRTNRLSVAQAAATATAVTVVVAGAVAVGVASGVAGAMAGGREFKKSGSELLFLIYFRKLTFTNFYLRP
jgi:cysteine-rich repeat protein